MTVWWGCGSGAPLRFLGLDVTLQVELGRADADRLKATGRPFAAYAGECAHAWIDYLAQTYPGKDFHSAPMHDALAVAAVAVAKPTLVTWRPARVEVEVCSDITRGVTVADLLAPQPRRRPTAWWARRSTPPPSSSSSSTTCTHSDDRRLFTDPAFLNSLKITLLFGILVNPL